MKMKMPEIVCVRITIQMKNDFRYAETCLAFSIIDLYAQAMLDEINCPGKNMIGKTILDQVTAMARANAALMGYELTNVATASILD